MIPAARCRVNDEIDHSFDRAGLPPGLGHARDEAYEPREPVEARDLDRTRLDEQDERRARQPGEERELRRPRDPERPHEDRIDDDPDDERRADLGEAKKDLGDEVAHDGPHGRRTVVTPRTGGPEGPG